MTQRSHNVYLIMRRECTPNPCSLSSMTNHFNVSTDIPRIFCNDFYYNNNNLCIVPGCKVPSSLHSTLGAHLTLCHQSLASKTSVMICYNFWKSLPCCCFEPDVPGQPRRHARSVTSSGHNHRPISSPRLTFDTDLHARQHMAPHMPGGSSLSLTVPGEDGGRWGRGGLNGHAK